MCKTLTVLVAIASSPVLAADAFALLREAYASRDAAAAARAYAPDAVVEYAYTAEPPERYVGRAAIEASFKALFARLDPRVTLDLNFRLTASDGDARSGLYRLRVGSGKAGIGRFEVRLDPTGLFSSDRSTDAPPTAFEEAPGAVMLAADDELLDRAYYRRLAGRYRTSDGCVIVITRGSGRLFARDTCSLEWRGLTRVSGREWTAGETVRSEQAVASYRFSPLPEGGGGSPSVVITSKGRERRATQETPYRTEDVTFEAPDGTRLAGTVYVPAGPPRRWPATVLVHGSGPQDRDGYASIIAVLADELATAGRLVLAYDKRGSGESTGNGDRAGFDVLAGDAVAGMKLLSARADVDPRRVGMAGSSQAGWVAARAIADGAEPRDVFLLGAAGTALTVPEQNLFNTRVRMTCAGVAAADVALALEQQQAFFRFRADPNSAPTLDELTRRANAIPALRDWVSPDSQQVDRSGSAWYEVLDPLFDPLPVWRRYAGRAVFVFGAHDDSTPTSVAVERLRRLSSAVRVIPGAQHLGLVASGPCQAELTQVHRFAPQLFESLRQFARAP
jgi:alpha-beta hydrolase superfamily lysophospholipase/ketosteroid isomerase-like protein